MAIVMVPHRDCLPASGNLSQFRRLLPAAATPTWSRGIRAAHTRCRPEPAFALCPRPEGVANHVRLLEPQSFSKAAQRDDNKLGIIHGVRVVLNPSIGISTGVSQFLATARLPTGTDPCDIFVGSSAEASLQSENIRHTGSEGASHNLRVA